MTIAVDFGRKATKQFTQRISDTLTLCILMDSAFWFDIGPDKEILFALNFNYFHTH